MKPTPENPKYFDVVCAFFVAVYLVSQVASVKLFALGTFTFPGAIIIFPIAYIFGDVLTEVYGYARTRRAIWIGLFSATFLAIVLWVVQLLPPAAGWPHQQAYDVILGFVPRVVLGSIAAYWVGEFVNSFVMAKMKVWTNGKYLWTRTISSTVVGQAVDSLVFVLIAFSGVIPLSVIFQVVGSVYAFKVAYEVVATPITYAVIIWLKRIEGIDVYDRNTNFTPFKF